MAEQQRASRVARVKQIFNGDAVGRQRAQLIAQSVVDHSKPRREAHAGRTGERAARDKPMPGSVGIHAAIPGADGPGVDPENSHASEASISCSSISTLLQTFFVSSW